jgi:hypothetical protein
MCDDIACALVLIEDTCLQIANKTLVQLRMPARSANNLLRCGTQFDVVKLGNKKIGIRKFAKTILNCYFVTLSVGHLVTGHLVS